ncbi:hypothetical protein LJC31_08225 [Synergistaceae bacterium OttesenSCG-928-I11]|nr:hypothetical protein [Synergistaceae bacterium OttesenSCG-928-I11]
MMVIYDFIHADADEVIDHENITKALIPQYEFNNIYMVKGIHQLPVTDEVAAILKNIIKPPRIKEKGIRRVLGLNDMRLP